MGLLYDGQTLITVVIIFRWGCCASDSPLFFTEWGTDAAYPASVNIRSDIRSARPS